MNLSEAANFLAQMLLLWKNFNLFLCMEVEIEIEVNNELCCSSWLQQLATTKTPSGRTANTSIMDLLSPLDNSSLDTSLGWKKKNLLGVHNIPAILPLAKVEAWESPIPR